MAFFLATQLEMLAEGSLLSDKNKNLFYFSEDIGASHGETRKILTGRKYYTESYVSLANSMNEMTAFFEPRPSRTLALVEASKS